MRGIHRWVTGGFPSQRASHAESVSIWWRNHVDPLTHCVQLTPYGDIILGKHWLRQSPFACWHLAIIRTKVDLLSKGFCRTQLRAISQELLMNHSMCLEITFLKLLPLLPGAIELNAAYIHHQLGLFSELSKLIWRKYTMSDIIFIVIISSWNFVRLSKAWRWTRVQRCSYKLS